MGESNILLISKSVHKISVSVLPISSTNKITEILLKSDVKHHNPNLNINSVDMIHKKNIYINLIYEKIVLKYHIKSSQKGHLNN